MENEEGMSSVTKALISFGILMVIGFIIVGTTKESPTDKLEAAFIHSSMLSKQAMEKCGAAIYSRTKERVYTPTESSSDQSTFVHLIWRNSGNVKDAECRYEQEKGITLLKFNGQALN